MYFFNSLEHFSIVMHKGFAPAKPPRRLVSADTNVLGHVLATSLPPSSVGEMTPPLTANISSPIQPYGNLSFQPVNQDLNTVHSSVPLSDTGKLQQHQQEVASQMISFRRNKVTSSISMPPGGAAGGDGSNSIPVTVRRDTSPSWAQSSVISTSSRCSYTEEAFDDRYHHQHRISSNATLPYQSSRLSTFSNVDLSNKRHSGRSQHQDSSRSQASEGDQPTLQTTNDALKTTELCNNMDQFQRERITTNSLDRGQTLLKNFPIDTKENDEITIARSNSLDSRSKILNKPSGHSGYQKKTWNKINRSPPLAHPKMKGNFLCHDCISSDDDSVQFLASPPCAQEITNIKGVPEDVPIRKEQYKMREIMFKELLARTKPTESLKSKYSILDSHAHHLSSIDEASSQQLSASNTNRKLTKKLVKPKVPVRPTKQSLNANNKNNIVAGNSELASRTTSTQIGRSSHQDNQRKVELGAGVRNSTFISHDEASHIFEEKPLDFNYPSIDDTFTPCTPLTPTETCSSPGDVFEMTTKIFASSMIPNALPCITSSAPSSTSCNKQQYQPSLSSVSSLNSSKSSVASSLMQANLSPTEVVTIIFLLDASNLARKPCY